MTRDMLIEWIYKHLVLVAGQIPLNICKVFTAAFIAGTVFCGTCLEGPYTMRACFAMLVCLILSAFFGTLTTIGLELEETDEEDDLYM